MATNSNGLCSVCANIDLKEYFRCETHVRRIDNDLIGPNQDALRLGYLEDIGRRSRACSFCRLVIEALCKRWLRCEWITPQELLNRDRTEGMKKECYIFSYLYADNRGSNAASAESLSEARDSQRAYRIGIGTRAPINERAAPFLDHAGDIQLSAISAVQCGISGLFHGRVFDSERVNMRMARNWLSECENHHERKCEHPAIEIGESVSPVYPRDLLVIDIQRMSLCQMPHGSRYIALSYCWPKVNTFVTTKSTVTGLFIPGALRENEEQIFQTIQDAIQCVNELGERYLWVDALCIIQDDEQHKSSQIQQMDRVYESSLLTLICAPPDPRICAEAYKGLPGYRKGTRITQQNIYQVQGMELLVPFSDVGSAIRGSRWSNRAWTYQEGTLSMRKLYFTEMQIYFQCSCAVFCEDSVGEGINSSAFIYPGTNLWNSNGLYSSNWNDQKGSMTWLSRTPFDDPVEAIEAYSRSLDQFSGREMSNPRDIIASFQGILSVFQKSMKTDFWFGLPEAYLDEALLWVDCGPSLRRTISITPSSKMIFPSWSWAGWDTAVDLDSIFFGYIHPEVDWFLVSLTGEAIQLVTPGSYNPSVHPKIESCNKNIHPPAELPDNFLNTVQPRSGISESKKSELPRFLACWTCIALFGISDETLDVDKNKGTNWDFREHLLVLDNMGHWAGSIFLGQGWKDNIVGNSLTFEFMLLSRSNTLDESLEYYDVDVFTSKEWCFLNVMLIQRDEDRAQRLGIGVIHEDAWIEARPVPMLIKLE